MIQPRTSVAVAEELSAAGWTLLPDGVWRAPGADNRHCWAVALKLCRAGESHMPLIVMPKNYGKVRTEPKGRGNHGKMGRPKKSPEVIAEIRHCREIEGLSLVATAARLGISQATVQQYQRPDRNPAFDRAGNTRRAWEKRRAA